MFGVCHVFIIVGMFCANLVARNRFTGNQGFVASAQLGLKIANTVSIRAIDEQSITVIRQDDKRVIDELPRSTAYFEVYPGAILLNQGLEYIITDLDTGSGVAQATVCEVDYYTKSRDHTDVR